jgi:hypothetical protein
VPIDLVYAAYSLLISGVDLTRACCASENYDAWIAVHGQAMGSPGIAHYFVLAAKTFAEHPMVRKPDFNAFAARETLADILMASAPLDQEQLREASSLSVLDAVEVAL